MASTLGIIAVASRLLENYQQNREIKCIKIQKIFK